MSLRFSERFFFIIFSYFVFIGMPLLLATVIGFMSLDHLSDAWKRERDVRYKQLLDKIVIAQDLNSQLERKVRPLLLDIREFWGSSYIFLEVKSNLEKQLGHIQLFVFQGDKVRYDFGDPSEREFLQKLFKYICRPLNLTRAAKKIQNELKLRWGKHLSLKYIQARNGEFIPIRTAAGFAVVFIEFNKDNQRTAIIFKHLPSNLMTNFLTAFRRKERYRHLIGKAVPELGVWNPPRGFSSTQMAVAYQLCDKLGTRIYYSNNISWFFLRDRFGKIISLTVTNRKADNWTNSMKLFLLYSAIFLSLWGIWILKKIREKRKTNFVSIKTQLWALFLYITFIPLIATLVLGWVCIQDQKDKIRHAVFRESLEKIQNMAAEAGPIRQDFLLACRYFRNHPSVKNLDRAGILALISQLKQDYDFEFVNIYDAEQNLFLHTYPESKKSIIVGMINMVKMALEKYAPNRLSKEHATKIDPIAVLAESVSSNDDMGWASVLQYRDTLNDINLAKLPTTYYWDVFPEISTGPSFVSIAQELEKILGNRLARRLAHSPRPDSFFWYWRNADPVPFRRTREMRVVENLMLLSGKVNGLVEWEVVLPSGLAWMVAMNENIYGRFAFSCFQMAEPHLRQLLPLKSGIVLGVILSLIVSLLSGKLLSEMFLGPINDLMEGMEAIRLRKKNFEIPCRRLDEFGELAGIFNRMLKEFQELEFASLVQKQLFPETLPTIEGYQIAALTQSAADLGGDYFDVWTLEDGRIAFLIGDATGHGVSAGLAVAIAKAILIDSCNNREFNSKFFLETLNKVFYRELKPQRKFMTLLHGILNPKTHVIELQNAGHNYPIVYKADQKIAYSNGLPGFPLGIKANLSLPIYNIELAPGDVVLFYTDGYSECPLKNGTLLGDKGLETLLTRFSQETESVQEIINKLVVFLDSARAQGPLLDDVTLIILKRNFTSTKL